MNVNGVSEKDVELMEGYLDDALAPEEVETLRARLVEEPVLAEALDGLKSERSVRSAVWQSLEPSPREAGQFAAKVSAAVRRDAFWAVVGRRARFGSAAAACLLVGFFAGWLGRDRGNDPRADAGREPGVVASQIDAPTIARSPTGNLGVIIDEIAYRKSGQLIPVLVVREVSANSPAAAAGLRQGDLILSLDGQRVRDVRALANAIESRGGTRILRIVRDGDLVDLGVRFGR